MKAYTVKQNTYDFYNGQMTGTKIIGHYLNKATAERVVNENKENQYHTVGNAYIEEMEINEE